MEVLESGGGEVRLSDVDEVRQWMREKKTRKLIDKLTDEKTAVEKYVFDGAYLSYDLSSMVRGPMSLEREIVRQRKKDLWIAAKFTLLDTTLLLGGGCLAKIDVGFAGLGRTLFAAIESGRVKTIDWSNGTLALRNMAGAMGVPYLPTRALLGTDTFKRSGAKVVRDPFTNKKICIVPAVNPDVAIIHVNQADRHGNCRIFGASVAPLETAMASKRVIVSTEADRSRGSGASPAGRRFPTSWSTPWCSPPSAPTPGPAPACTPTTRRTSTSSSPRATTPRC